MNNQKFLSYVQAGLKNNLLAAVFPRDGKEESAKKLKQLVDSAVCVAEFKNDNGDSYWGVLINKAEEFKHLQEISIEENK